MLEKMFDRPYLKGRVGPETVAALAVIGREVRRAVPLPPGIQVLAAATEEALAVALACGAAFVRVEGFVFAHVADERLIQADAGSLLRSRAALGAERVRVFADIKKKHAAHALTAAVGIPTLLGSGVTPDNVASFTTADGLIVGSSVQQRGDWRMPLDADAVGCLADAFAAAGGTGKGHGR